MTPEELQTLQNEIISLKFWRKGPFRLFGIDIDAEWRCDLKWDRLLPNLPPMTGKTILDVGCNNGYFMFRMLEHDPKSVLGIDPNDLFFKQFQLIQRYIQSQKLTFKQIGWQELQSTGFDIIFCMGILYHEREPRPLLNKLKSLLNPGGEIILETLILEGDGDANLVPKKYYAGMRNVFNIPTLPRLKMWIEDAGFSNAEVIDVTRTTTAEQRVTPLAGNVSFAYFLDINDPTKTSEGYPAPVRGSLRIRV